MNLHEGETASMVTVKCFFGGRLADILLGFWIAAIPISMREALAVFPVPRCPQMN
uniref:Uncharacterized protein n=1 Tax=Anguilla anguilla TaxID=7936 RepID=A0A0E9S3P8_ANGAN